MENSTTSHVFKKHRLVHLGKFYPPDNGGIESVTATLAQGAASAGLDTTVLCFEEHGRGNSRMQGVDVVRVSALKVASQPLSLEYLRRAAALTKVADIVHVHTPNMLAAVVVARIPKGPKVILHWHSDVVDKGLLGLVTRPLESAMLRRADKIVCTSAAYAAGSQSLAAFASKVEVIPIGVADQSLKKITTEEAISLLSPALRAHIAGRQLILAVGRLVPYKGYETLIDAAAKLTANAAIVVVGGGPLEPILRQQIASSGVADRILLAGRVDDVILNALLSCATVFCMPSVDRAEAFGVSIVEAMSYGLPVVATQIQGSGVPWVNLHGVSGLNVPVRDPVALASTLDLLLGNHSLRETLSHGARARFESLFTLPQFVCKFLDLYDALGSKK